VFPLEFFLLKTARKPLLHILLKQRSIKYLYNGQTAQTEQTKGKRKTTERERNPNYISIQIKNAKKAGALVKAKSVRLQDSLPKETSFPILEIGRAPVKHKIIPLLSYLPGCNDEEFHEEIMVELSFSLFHHYVEREVKPPIDV
jgi:hypothetical protein